MFYFCSIFCISLFSAPIESSLIAQCSGREQTCQSRKSDGFYLRKTKTRENNVYIAYDMNSLLCIFEDKWLDD